MLPEDAILLPEIVDAIFLVASHPASQGQHEEVQSVGHGRRLHGSDTAVTHVVSGIHSPRLGRFLAPYGLETSYRIRASTPLAGRADLPHHGNSGRIGGRARQRG